MNVELLSRPANTAAKLTLSAGETVTTEGGAMIAMSDDMQVDTRVRKREGARIMSGFKRMLGGEGLFLNYFTAGPAGGELYLSTALPGDMEVVTLKSSVPLQVQSSSFVACEQPVDLDAKWGGLKNVFSGESLIWLRLSGEGRAVINSFGAIYAVEVDGEFVVDTGNIAAFEETLDFSVKKAGRSLVGSFAGGEGLVTRFQGRGTVYCQTHADRLFGRRLTPHLRTKKQ